MCKKMQNIQSFVRVLFVLLLLLCHALARDVVHCIVECAQPSYWPGCLALSIAIYFTEKPHPTVTPCNGDSL